MIRVEAQDLAKPATASPSYRGLTSRSETASKAARGASRKKDTAPELLLRRALYRRGLRYRVNVADLPGKPDIVFRSARLVLFCDGDFWHGRDLKRRIARLEAGHNAEYWVAKITRNVERDRQCDAALARAGWHVVRAWESDIRRDPEALALEIENLVRRRSPGKRANIR